MSLPAGALTTVANVRAFLLDAPVGASTDAMLERLIVEVTQYAERFCGRKFGRAERTIFIAPPDGCRLQLPNAPLVNWSVDTNASAPVITVDGADYADFELEDANLGWLWRDAGWGYVPTSDGVLGLGTVPGYERKSLKAVYTSGWWLPSQTDGAAPQYVLGADDSLPIDLENAVIQTVVSRYRRRGNDQASPAFDNENQAIGRGTYGIIPSSAMPVFRAYAVGW